MIYLLMLENEKATVALFFFTPRNIDGWHNKRWYEENFRILTNWIESKLHDIQQGIVNGKVVSVWSLKGHVTNLSRKNTLDIDAAKLKLRIWVYGDVQRKRWVIRKRYQRVLQQKNHLAR